MTRQKEKIVLKYNRTMEAYEVTQLVNRLEPTVRSYLTRKEVENLMKHQPIWLDIFIN